MLCPQGLENPLPVCNLHLHSLHVPPFVHQSSNPTIDLIAALRGVHFRFRGNHSVQDVTTRCGIITTLQARAHINAKRILVFTQLGVFVFRIAGAICVNYFRLVAKADILRDLSYTDNGFLRSEYSHKERL